MNLAKGALLSLTYILGLLFTAILGFPARQPTWGSIAILAVGLMAVGGIAAIAIPRAWRAGPKPQQWLAAGCVAAFAIVYFQLRVPQPGLNDISRFVPSEAVPASEQVMTVTGIVEEVPRLTRSSRTQLWLTATQLTESEGGEAQSVTGKLYVTLPILQATGLYPGQSIEIAGTLYEPKPAANPGAFDFAAYLAKEGAFAGLSGRQVQVLNETQESPWGWWMLRQRILRAQVRGLGSPVGQLVSSIVLGRRAVDLPYDIRDQFIQAGLAHVLAASGFHVSLILGLILALTKRWGDRWQFGMGLGALIVYVGLTGLQPSVMRAAIMGVGALVALVTQRKVKPLGSLLLAATILLLFNPLWIWDLGFQLSFLATLGLLVTAPPITKRLDWLPPAIASLIAIPLAASLWTLPLQLYVFGMVPPYSIATNVITTPLITAVSIGGVISALVALILPPAGSTLASILWYPSRGLMELVEFFNQLPGSSVAVGTIPLWQLLLLYGAIAIACIPYKERRRLWLIGAITLLLVILPIWQMRAATFQVTVLAADREQVMVIQDRGQVTLVNSGETDTANFTILPFLQKQGVNQIDWAVALNTQPQQRSGWLQVLDRLPIETFYDVAESRSLSADAGETEPMPPEMSIASRVQTLQGNYQPLSIGQLLSVGSIPMELLEVDPWALQLRIRDRAWLILGDMMPDIQQQLAATGNLQPIQVLCWSGGSLAPELLTVLKPEVAIAMSDTLNPETAQLLLNAGITLYWTGRDGAVQWTPRQGFTTTLEVFDSDAPLL
jgi:competence protein ComEC